MFDWFLRRNKEPSHEQAREDARDIGDMANDPEFDGFEAMGEIPPTPPDGEDELTTNPPIERRRQWWHLW